MIAFRHADPRFPFLREDSSQTAGRWNAAGELSHCFCDTPDGAWAEFLRHEEITDPADLLTIRRALWAVDIGEPTSLEPDLPQEVLTGGPENWPACREFAQTSSGRRGLHHRAFRRAALRWCAWLAGRWRPPARPRAGRHGHCTLWPSPRPRRLGRNNRRSPE